jgi:hypothetical protein
VSAFSTLKLSRPEQAEHDAEFLARLRGFGRPATVAELFVGSEPVWAIDAAERLEVAGEVFADAGGRLTPRKKEREACPRQPPTSPT